jgi:hypothetical protein
MEMKDEKMIEEKEELEELVGDIAKGLQGVLLCEIIHLAKTLYNAGYRKISEESNLISKKDCLVLKNQVKELLRLTSYQEILISEIRNETGKNIYSKIIELSENPCNSREDIYKKVFKPYGVEIKEV